MEFKSKTAIHEFFWQLEKEGWITPRWVSNTDGKTTHAEKLFKINFTLQENG